MLHGVSYKLFKMSACDLNTRLSDGMIEVVGSWEINSKADTLNSSDNVLHH